MKTLTNYFPYEILVLHIYLYLLDLFVVPIIDRYKMEKFHLYFFNLLPARGKIFNSAFTIGFPSYNLAKSVLQGAAKIIQKHQTKNYCEPWDIKNRKNCSRGPNNWGYTPLVLKKMEFIAYDAIKHHKPSLIYIPNSLND